MTLKMNQKPTIIFLGNTKYSIIGAQPLHTVYPISLFVTIPDKETGRKKLLTPSPVKLLAKSLHVPYLETNSITPEVIQQVRHHKPDFLVVEDYGLILPKTLLDIPKYAPLNIHHSLLPKYRGASPAPSAILAGEKISGVSIIKMTEKVDAGDILAKKEYILAEDETTQSLLTILNKIGGGLVTQVIKDYLQGTVKPISQDPTQATFTKMIKKEDAYFDIDNPPAPKVLNRMIRAYYPWPGVWTRWNNKIVKLHPKGVIGYMFQMEGKKPVKLEEFLRGHPNFPIKNF